MIIVDTGPLYAAADASDDHHIACARLFEHPPDRLVVPVGVERLHATTLLSLDRRHFAVVRPRHTSAFTLLP